MTSSGRPHLESISAEELLDLTHDTVMARDLDGTIRYWNHGAEEMYGISKDDAIGKKSHDLLRTRFPKPLDEIDREVLSAGRWEGELTHFAHDDRAVIVASRWAVKRDSSGQALAILEINNDITSRKAAEEALIKSFESRSEEQMRELVEAAPNGMIMTDRGGTILTINAQTERIFGYSRDDLLGKSIEMLVPESARAAHPAHRQSFFAEPRARMMGVGRDLYGQRRDGTLIPVEIGLNPLVKGAETFVLASIVDITERKQSERAIRESEERFRLLMSGIRDYAIFLLDPSGHIVSWDEGAQRIKGYEKAEIIGKHLSVFYPANEVKLGKASADLHIAATQDRFEDEGWRVRKDGSRFYANNVIAALKDDEGNLLGFAKVTRDITERRRAETVLQHKLLELERSNEDLQQFAYVCSHDLQEPLRVISNYTQLLVQRYSENLDEDATEFVEFILDATKRMQQLINDLLSYSRVQTRGEQFKEVDCSAILDKVLANLKVSIDEANMTIRRTPLPTVVGDQSQIMQVFQNLLSNAIKFRSKEDPEVDISAQDEPDWWTFTVHDNGVGFDVKYADRIFVIFQRLHTKESYPGSGIGLAICKKIVERHGGRIWVESAEGKGSAFHFRIPKQSETTGT